MALRKILLDGDELLNKKSREVTDFDDRLAVLLDDMAETMRNANGLGLAAVQVGVLRRVAIIESEDRETVLELVNPVIIKTSEEVICGTEGCLSFPDEQALVERPKRVTVKAQNRQGEFFEFTGEDMVARALNHEIDHLDGIVFLSKALSDEEVEEYLLEMKEAEALAQELGEDYDDDYDDEGYDEDYYEGDSDEEAVINDKNFPYS